MPDWQVEKISEMHNNDFGLKTLVTPLKKLADREIHKVPEVHSKIERWLYRLSRITAF